MHMKKEKENCIGRDVIRQWRAKQGRDAQYRFYFSEIRPLITDLLRKRVKMMEGSGSIPRYRNLALILGHDVNPALITANAFMPQRLLVFHTDRNRSLLERRFLPSLDPGIPADQITRLELDYTDHDRNTLMMQSALSECAATGATICDITGGKKILSVLLGTAAGSLGIDISYIDSDAYVEGTGTPEPGRESLYIRSAAEGRTTEIRPSARDRLTLNYSPASHEITCNLDTSSGPAKFVIRGLSDSSVDELRKEISLLSERINCAIMSGCTDNRDLDAMENLVFSLMADSGLDRRLSQEGGSDMLLITDPELAGVPWELVLHRRYSIPLPVFRMFNRDFEYRQAKPQGGEREAMVIFGNSEGLPGFVRLRDDLRHAAAKAGVRARFIDAESLGRLQVELLRGGVDTIIYCGHSSEKSHGEASGWLCQNGEEFTRDSLSLLRGDPPEMIISNACMSARSRPFEGESFACASMDAGVRTFIGTRWLLEFERSAVFLSEIIRCSAAGGPGPSGAFSRAIGLLSEIYGEDDLSLYNYVYYGR